MFSLLVLALSTSAVLAAPRINSPLPQLDGRIVGGEDANIEDYPYQLSLQYHGSHICGASIISENYAVTAAHCTDGSGAHSMSVRAGSSIRGEGGIVVPIRQIHQNPSYEPSTIDFDISILEFEHPLEMGAGIQPITLPSSGQNPADGADAIVSGWGTTSSGGSLPKQLQVVTVQVVNQDECNSAYGGQITDRMICAGVPEGGKDSCQGDSGGPLISEGNLAGIVSWGYGCALPEYPGVYSRVSTLRDFITEITGM